MIRFVLITLFFITSIASANSQIKATSHEGKPVLLHSDGTWEYEEEEKRTASTENASTSTCSDLIKEEEDRVTGEMRVASKETIVISDDGGKTGFGMLLLLSSSGKTIIWSVQAVGAGSCIDDDDRMNILFRDGTRAELTNDSKFNCDASFTLYFGGPFAKKKYLNMFATKEIETLRVWTSDGYVEKDLDPEESRMIMQSFNCLEDRI